MSAPTVYRRIAEGSIAAYRVASDVGPLRIFEDELKAALRPLYSENPAERRAPERPAVEARAHDGTSA